MSTKLNWTPVKSTQIKRIAHDADTNTAVVHFNNGTIYEYGTFSAEKFELFKSSESAGKFLGAEVKGKHPYKKVTDPAQLMEMMIEEKAHIKEGAEYPPRTPASEIEETPPKFGRETGKICHACQCQIDEDDCGCNPHDT